MEGIQSLKEWASCKHWYFNFFNTQRQTCDRTNIKMPNHQRKWNFGHLDFYFLCTCLYFVLFFLFKTTLFIVLFLHSRCSRYFSVSDNVLLFPEDTAMNKFPILINQVFYQDCSKYWLLCQPMLWDWTWPRCGTQFQVTLDGQVIWINSAFFGVCILLFFNWGEIHII